MIEELVSELSEKDNLVVFAGSGVSQAAGIPGWKDLMESLLQAAQRFFDPDNYSNMLEEIKIPNNYPIIAQKIYDCLKAVDEENIYFETLKNSLEPEISDATYQHIIITKAVDNIITTNFDTGFEVAFEDIEGNKEDLIIEVLPTFEEENLHKKKLIAYIHGKTDEQFIIFKKKDYENYYPSLYGTTTGSDDLETYLKYLYKKFTLIFVGFSFEDYHIREFFKMQKERIKQNDKINSSKPGYIPVLNEIKHYAFIKEIEYEDNDYLKENYREFDADSEDAKRARKLFEFEKLKTELKSINIEPCIISHHVDSTRCFKKIGQLKKRSKATIITRSGHDEI